MTPHPPAHAWKHAVFVLGAIFCVTPWASAPIALGIGAALALGKMTAWDKHSKLVSRQMIQWSVATLGLLIPLPRLVDIAREGLVFALATIAGTFVLGIIGARLLRLEREQTILISSGTAICGGSAIAAVGASIGASSAGMAIATGAIFLLNAAALYLFPVVGHMLHMSDAQFGTWAGVAIHDVSSVTGAASVYHADTPGVSGTALEIATIVKLSRVLWIVPIALAAEFVVRRGKPGAGQPVPWLIILFIAASLLATFVGAIADYQAQIRSVAKLGFQLALYLIGAGLSVAALRSVGWRALVLALGLWVAIAGASLAVVMTTMD